MSSSSVESLLDMDEIEKDLLEIENKYFPTTQDPNGLEDANVLSKELDALGRKPIDFSRSHQSICNDLIKTARSLIHLHWQTKSEVKDVSVENISKDAIQNDLHRKIDALYSKLDKMASQKQSLEHKIAKLNSDKIEMKRTELYLKEDAKKSKQYYKSKENELQHKISALVKENERLQQLCREDINPNGSSKTDVALKIIRKLKDKEEIYVETIKKLRDNNEMLIEELVNLKRDLPH